MTRNKAVASGAAGVVALVLVVAATVYRASDRLGDVPVLGPLLAPVAHLPADGGMHDMTRSAETADVEGMDMPAAQEEMDATMTDPRVAITLDLRRQQLIGVRTALVERGMATRMVRTVGAVRYDETRLTDVNLKVGGWIRELYVDYTGRAVQVGDPLFTLYSPELLTTMQEYLLAMRTREQVDQSQIPDAREYADRLVAAARQRIELWDLPADQLEALDASGEAQTAVTFRSPAGGYVIEKHAVEGMYVEPGETLYQIADLSSVWVEADVYEQEMAVVREGLAATVTLDAYPGEQVTGRIVYLYPFVEPNTRTVRVRFEVPNPAGRLRPGMYANVVLEAPVGLSTTIPTNALLDSGSRQLVFVAEGSGYFQPRDVRAGQRLGEQVQILAGLDEGERVATNAAFFLDSESQLRASVQAFEPAPEMAQAGAGEQLEITFRSTPDPPRTGESTFEVTVRDAEGRPVADAEVSVTFFMAAMPSMNMPAMRNDAALLHAGDGVYRGSGQVIMAGRWDVTVTVTRGGMRLGSRQLSFVAR